MFKLPALFLFLIAISWHSFGQAGQWTWIHGSQSANSAGNYGTKGVSSPSNEPPNIYEGNEWTDLQGNFWFFGGASAGPFALHSDLWKYTPSNNEWTWISGPGYAVSGDPGNY